MDNLKNLSKQVLYELEKKPITRSSDRWLIVELYMDFYHLDWAESWAEVVMDASLPPFESIRRARQKVQEIREDLRADAPVEEERINKQVEFLNFAELTEI
jgi:hypothetical protein